MEQYNIFDFDGTLADSMYVWEDCLPALLRRLGREPDPRLTRNLVHMSLPDSLRCLREDYRLAQTEDELLAILLDRVDEEYRYHIPLKPGARQVLETLHQHRCRCCIATSNDTSLVSAAVERTGIAPYIECIVSARPGAGKDRPDVFLEALHRIGGSDPARAAVFEDTPRCAATAIKAGFQVYALQDGPLTARDMPGGLRAYLTCWQDWSEEL